VFENAQFYGVDAPAQTTERLIQHDPAETGAKSRISLKRVETGEGAAISGLHDVFGLAIVSNNASRKTVETAIVLLQDYADGALITADGSIDEPHLRSIWQWKRWRGHFRSPDARKST
jgi:hypothetical protein